MARFDTRPYPKVLHGYPVVGTHFTFPPVPIDMFPGNGFPLTDRQDCILRFLDGWHWKWSPSTRDIARGVERNVKTTYQTMQSLRRLGLIDWMKGEDRTLFLTPLGQAFLGLYVGPMRTHEPKRLDTYTVYGGEERGRAFGLQKVIVRRRGRFYRQRQKPYKVAPSMMLYRQHTYPRRRESSEYTRDVPTHGDPLLVRED